jgi:hypothetical protein
MTYRGRVKNGVVVLEEGERLAEGTLVDVEPVPGDSATVAPTVLSPLFRAGERAKPTGIPDLAINHDHYLYGHAKVANG